MAEKSPVSVFAYLAGGVTAVLLGMSGIARAEPLHEAEKKGSDIATRANAHALAASAAARNSAVRTALRENNPLAAGQAKKIDMAGIANEKARAQAAARLRGGPEASNGDTDLMSDKDAALVIKRTLSPDRTARTTVVVPRLKL